uniref:ProQ/FINO family protein n=19 Tax=Escherichia coli TaxID=562 RepID=UPI00237F5DFB
ALFVLWNSGLSHSTGKKTGLSHSTGKKTKPLKVGIPDDLIQDIAIRELAFGAGTLHAAVASYVQSPRYYRALIAGGARYNLNGQPCGEVTPQEQKEAETRLMMLNDRRKARKPR